MTAGFGVPIADVFSDIDPDEVARNFDQDKTDAQIRASNSATAMTQLIAQTNVIAGRIPQVLFLKILVLPREGGTNYLFRWCHPDYVQNASEHEFRVLSRIRPVDPATGNAYWARLDSTLTEDSDCQGAEYSSICTASYNISQIFDERAFTARTGALRPPTDSVVEEGIICKHDHQVLGLIVQDRALTSLDIEDHACVVSKPQQGDPVLANFGEKIRSVLHEVRTTNLPIVLRWAAVGDGASFTPPSTPANTATEKGIHIESNTYINVLAPTLSVAGSFETYSATTPGFMCHQYACGLGDPDYAANTELTIDCYVLAEATTADGKVRFEGPSSIASNNTEITIPTASGLDWFGGTSVKLDTSSTNDDVTTARHKIDVCAKAGASGEVDIFGLMAHVSWI
jgi:hypothetical protein